MGAREEREAFAAGFNLAMSHLRGYIAARGDANRTHLMQNVNAIKDALRDDVTGTGTEAGAMTEAFLVALGDIPQLLCERIAGADAREQLKALEQAIEAQGERINDSADGHPPFPVPGWDSAQCVGCGEPVFEIEDFKIVLRDGVPLPFHPDC